MAILNPLAIDYIGTPLGLAEADLLPSRGGFTANTDVWTNYNPTDDILTINRNGVNPLTGNLNTTPTTNAKTDWGGILGGIGLGFQGLSGLANAYLGYKNYELAQKEFNFQKGLANRNLANQAKLINNQYDNAAQVAAGMIGGTDSRGNYGLTRQDVVDRYAANARKRYVDGSYIG